VTNAAAVISAETAMFIADNKDNLDQSDHLSSWSVLTHCTVLNVVFVPYKDISHVHFGGMCTIGAHTRLG